MISSSAPGAMIDCGRSARAMSGFQIRQSAAPITTRPHKPHETPRIPPIMILAEDRPDCGRRESYELISCKARLCSIGRNGGFSRHSPRPTSRRHLHHFCHEDLARLDNALRPVAKTTIRKRTGGCERNRNATGSGVDVVGGFCSWPFAPEAEFFQRCIDLTDFDAKPAPIREDEERVSVDDILQPDEKRKRERFIPVTRFALARPADEESTCGNLVRPPRHGDFFVISTIGASNSTSRCCSISNRLTRAFRRTATC